MVAANNSPTTLLVIEKKGSKIFCLVHFDVWFFCSLHPTLLLFEFAVVVVIALNGTALTTERASSVPHYSLLFRSEKERERERMKRETKCKICEYLHNWMIWYSIRQFECLSSLWCVRVERPTSSKDRFVYISSLSHSMLLHLFKEIFRTTYTSVTREREEVREKTKISGSFGRMHQERQS